MASLRGGQQLWTNTLVNNGDKSPLVVVGSGPYVSLFVQNLGGVNSATFTVEASGTASPKPGRNALDATADGGLVWYAYNKDGAGITIVVAAGASAMVDLSPFGPQFVRLHCTTGGNTNITAIATVYGPN